jgi:phage baseplate assembly protein W
MVKRALAIEDGNLGTPALVTSRKTDYKDIDLVFDARPSGDVYKKTDAAAVKQAVKNLLLTNPGEKPFLPEFGAGLNRLLFELIDDDAEEEIDDMIRVSIENYEPRASVQDIDIDIAPDLNAVSVRLTFRILSTGEEVVLETSLARVR